MKRVRVIAHYKTATVTNMCLLASFETELPDDEAYRLMNDREGKRRLVKLHYPSATEIIGEVNYAVIS
jgi:hypothetical protein